MHKFTSAKVAKSFSCKTVKPTAVVMGDDDKYWVVSLKKMEELLKAGYELVK